jgi:hypothetical protein
MLLNIARQLGKSTTVAALAAHTARYEPGALILCLSPGERQSAELHRKVKASLAALGLQGVDLEVDNILSTELANGSRLVALPGREDTIRGFSSARLLLVDEAARVRDDLYYAAAPMLEAGRGRLVALSTPKGRRGWWYEMSVTRIRGRPCVRPPSPAPGPPRRPTAGWRPRSGAHAAAGEGTANRRPRPH